MNILFLIGGLILILLGANGLTDGAASVAKRLRIPSIVIGLTIVAFGTSAPELTVSVSSALKGSADIAIGNVVGWRGPRRWNAWRGRRLPRLLQCR